MLKAVVSGAEVQDRDGGILVGQAVRLYGPDLPRLRHVWADSAYAGSFVDWTREHMGWTVEIVKKTEEQAERKGFAVQPHRWIVERTFSWLGGQRRLAKDFEAQVESSEAMLYVAMIPLLARRLARAQV